MVVAGRGSPADWEGNVSVGSVQVRTFRNQLSTVRQHDESSQTHPLWLRGSQAHFLISFSASPGLRHALRARGLGPGPKAHRRNGLLARFGHSRPPPAATVTVSGWPQAQGNTGPSCGAADRLLAWQWQPGSAAGTGPSEDGAFWPCGRAHRPRSGPDFLCASRMPASRFACFRDLPFLRCEARCDVVTDERLRGGLQQKPHRTADAPAVPLRPPRLGLLQLLLLLPRVLF